MNVLLDLSPAVLILLVDGVQTSDVFLELFVSLIQSCRKRRQIIKG